MRCLIMELPIAPVGRILKNAGAQRVSDDAKIALTKLSKNVETKSLKKLLDLHVTQVEKPLKQKILN